MTIQYPDTLKSIHDVRPGDYVIHTGDRFRLEMLLEVKGIMGTNLVVNYLFGKWTRPENFFVQPTDVHKAEDIYANDIRLFDRSANNRGNEVSALIKYKHLVYILKNM